MMRMGTSLLLVTMLSACGPASPPRWAGRECTPAPRSLYERDLALPGRTLNVPPECCFVPGPLGGQIRCPESALSWSLFASPPGAQQVLDEYVNTYRNNTAGRVRERQLTCAIIGVPSPCYQFSAEEIPGPLQRLEALVGAVTVQGKGLVAACQWVRGAGRPAVCRQLFTP